MNLYSDGCLYKSLLDRMVDEDLALRTVIDSFELLVFTSLQLPKESWSEFKQLPYRISIHIFYLFYLRCKSNFFSKNKMMLDDNYAGLVGNYYLWGVLKKSSPIST